MLYDRPTSPDIEIPAAADPDAMPLDAELRPGRRRAKRRGLADADGDPTEPLLSGGDVDGPAQEANENV